MKEHDSWDIIDSSKVQDYMSCARMFWWKHPLGWVHERPDVHLIFGTAWHKAMERLLPLDRRPDYSDENVAYAYALFEEEYRKYFPPESDLDRAPKIPANVIRGLMQYADLYRGDEFTTLFTEIAGSVFINTNYDKLYFKMDAIVDDPHYGIAAPEHKTGTTLGRVWTDSWTQKIQTGCYGHVLHSLYPDDQVYGIIINGFFPTNPPEMKLDGTPRARATDNKFIRIPIRRRIEQMEDWLYTVNYWYQKIQEDFDRLSSVSEDDPIMRAFPKNTENCTKYFGCPYQDFCVAWPNPLQRCQEPQIGFKVEHWDPRKVLDEAKKKVEV